jgi:hypothetical protein
MPNATIKWSAAVARSTGVAAQPIAAGGKYLGGEIDNAAGKDRFATLDVLLSCAVAPSAGRTMEVYLIYAVDGTHYEDGSATVVPPAMPAGAFSVRGVTGEQRLSLPNIPLAPLKFKVLCKSDLDQAATTTVLLVTHNEEIQ